MKLDNRPSALAWIFPLFLCVPSQLRAITVANRRATRPKIVYLFLCSILFTHYTLAEVTIVANDTDLSEPGANDGSFQLNINPAFSTDTPINIQYSGTAIHSTSGADYFAPLVVTVPANSTMAVILVDVKDDDIVEGDETVVASILAGSGYSVGAQNQAMVTIQDNDGSAGTVSFVGATYRINENDAVGQIAIKAVRTGGTNGEITVPYAVNGGTATINEDFTMVNPGKFVWGDGVATEKTFHVSIVPDNKFEPDETVLLKMAQPTGGATLGTVSQTTLTIVNDDVAKPGMVELIHSSLSADESGGRIAITARRVGGKDGEVIVPYAVTGGTAAIGVDYTLTNNPGKFIWGDQVDGEKVFHLTLTDDTLPEQNETIVIGFGKASGGANLGQSTTTLTITDNDTGGPGRIQFSDANYSISENETHLDVKVNRTGGVNGAAAVTVTTSDGLATSGADYTATNQTIQWADGQGGERVVRIPIADDALAEGNETFTVILNQASGGATLGATRQVVVTIVDNDVSGTVHLEATNIDVVENAGTVTININRSGGGSGAASVQVTTSDGTATAGQDYGHTTQTITWAAGESGARSIDISILDDSLSEGTETFNVTLDKVNGAKLGGPNQATVRIADIENTDSVQFTTTSYSGFENTGEVTISVARTGNGQGPASVSYRTMDGTATAGADYAANSGILSWVSGDTSSKSFTIPIIDDADNSEADETVLLTLSNARGARLGAPSSAQLTIRAQLGDVSTLQFAQDRFQVAENSGSTRLQVMRTGSNKGSVSVHYEIRGRNAILSADFTAKNGALNWADGDSTPKLIHIDLIDDKVLEGDETLEVFLNTPKGADLGATFSALITIRDDEVDSGPLSNLRGEIGETVEQQFQVSNLKRGIYLRAETGTVTPTFIEETSGMVTYRLTIPTNAKIGEILNDSVIITDADNIQTVVSARITVQQKISDLNNLSSNQQSVANAVDAVCAGANTESIRIRCTEINALNEDQQRQALEAIAPDEVAAQGIQSIEITHIQLSNLRTRLAALRSGVRGFAFNGLEFSIQEDRVPVGALLDGSMRTGGAAGDDILGEPNRWGGFINGRLNFGKKDSTTRETGFDFDKSVLTLGADYRIHDRLFIGGAIGLSSLDAEFVGGRGDLTSDAASLAFYGSYYNNRNYFADWVVGFGSNTYDTTRNIKYSGFSDQVVGEAQGDQYSISVNAGMDQQQGNLLLSPYARIDYVNVNIDGYRELGDTGLELTIGAQTVDSLAIALGSRLARSYSHNWGVLTPSIDLTLEREFLDNARQITARFVNDDRGEITITTDDPDRVYFNLGLGLAAQFTSNRAGFFRYDTALGQDHVSDNTIEAGFRMAF